MLGCNTRNCFQQSGQRLEPHRPRSDTMYERYDMSVADRLRPAGRQDQVLQRLAKRRINAEESAFQVGEYVLRRDTFRALTYASNLLGHIAEGRDLIGHINPP